MKKVLTLLCICLMSSTVLFAQNGNGFGYGVKAGINLSDMTNSTGSGRVGFVGGAFVDYSIERFGLELGFYYSEQGSNGVLDAYEHVDYHFNYINAQLLAKYQIFNGFRVFAGPQGGYIIKSTVQYEEHKEEYNNVAKWDIGITAGIGYTFKMGLDLSASYTRGLTNIFIDDRTAYNTTFKVSVGWVF